MTGLKPPTGPSPPLPQAAAPHKRNRIILSCAPCRASKLKCDRSQPCSQCAKRGTADSCQYAPRPERKKRSKGMAARLQRLEGMVRGMMDGEDTPAVGAGAGAAAPERSGAAPAWGGQVVQGERATTYVGATHIMAVLEDVRQQTELAVQC
jgi:hypothetical protein